MPTTKSKEDSKSKSSKPKSRVRETVEEVGKGVLFGPAYVGMKAARAVAKAIKSKRSRRQGKKK